MKNKKIYVHVDGDAFFVACEVARRPELLGKAVVVGEERGIVTALSYEAKRRGVVRGDPIFKIKKIYPDIVIVQSHFELYEMYSHKLYSILTEYTDEVEVYSVDECFMAFDLKYFKDKNVEDFFRELKRRVKVETGITYSFGVSYSKVTSKLASKHNKPDGLCLILDTDTRDVIYNSKDINEIWGIGPRTTMALRSMAVNTVSELLSISDVNINRVFGKTIMDIYNELRWENRLSIAKDTKQLRSMQATRSFEKTSSDRAYVYGELTRNIEQIASRLKASGLYTDELMIFIDEYQGRGVRAYTRYMSIKLGNHTRSVIDMLRSAAGAFDSIYTDGLRYKRTGVSALNLRDISQTQGDMFLDANVLSTSDAKLSNDTDISALRDIIKSKYGKDVLHVAASLSSRTVRADNLKIRDSRDSYVYGLPLPYMGVVR